MTSRRGVRPQEVDWARRDQRAHANVRRERSGKAVEVPLGESRDQRVAEISS
jgi:hypothetical protein